MKTPLMVGVLISCAASSVASAAQEIDKSLIVQEQKAGGDALKRYFLIRHKQPESETPKEYGLLLVLPGGSGDTNFLPFCANVVTVAGTPRDFIVAELVAPVWDAQQAWSVVWPGKAFRTKPRNLPPKSLSLP